MNKKNKKMVIADEISSVECYNHLRDKKIIVFGLKHSILNSNSKRWSTFYSNLYIRNKKNKIWKWKERNNQIVSKNDKKTNLK